MYRKPFNRIPLYLDTQALLKSQYWPREKLESLRTARLAELLKQATHLSFWNERFIRAHINVSRSFDQESFLKLPVTTRNDFQETTKDSYTDPRLLAHSYREQTSGSTARPFGFYHDRPFELRSYAICERMFRAVGGGNRFPVISIRTRERRGFAFSRYHFFHVRGFNSLRYRFAQLIELILSFKGKVILFGFSSWVLELARLSREQQRSLPLRAVMVAGEELSDDRRSEIENVLNAKVSMYYAASELGRLAFECEHRRLHINEEWAYMEIVDDAGIPLPLGREGRIVVTVFDNLVMPFIRYNNGDRGVIAEDPCPCGRTLRTLLLKGRKIQTLGFADGRTVSFLDIPPVFDRYPTAIRQFQVVRTGNLSFCIRVIPGADFEKFRDTVAEQLRRLVHPHMQIAWESCGSLAEGPNGKAVYFIDETAVPRV